MNAIAIFAIVWAAGCSSALGGRQQRHVLSSRRVTDFAEEYRESKPREKEVSMSSLRALMCLMLSPRLTLAAFIPHCPLAEKKWMLKAVPNRASSYPEMVGRSIVETPGARRKASRRSGSRSARRAARERGLNYPMLQDAEKERTYAQHVRQLMEFRAKREILEAGYGRALTHDEWARDCNFNSTADFNSTLKLYEQSRERLITGNFYLVNAMANRLRGYQSAALAYEDMVMEGYLGLLKAVDSFDLKREVRFSTFAYPLIKFSILKANDRSELVYIGPYRKAQVKKLENAKGELMSTLQREPTDEELAKHLDVTERDVWVMQNLKNLRNPASLEQVQSDADSERTSAWHLLVDGGEPDIYEEMGYEMLVDHIDNALKNITAEQQELLILREGLDDGIPKSFQEIANHMNVSTQIARRRYVSTMHQLKDQLDAQYNGNLREVMGLTEGAAKYIEQPMELW